MSHYEEENFPDIPQNSMIKGYQNCTQDKASEIVRGGKEREGCKSKVGMCVKSMRRRSLRFSFVCLRF